MLKKASQNHKWIGNDKPKGVLCLESTMWISVLKVAMGELTVVGACRELESVMKGINWDLEEYQTARHFFKQGKSLYSCLCCRCY